MAVALQVESSLIVNGDRDEVHLVEAKGELDMGTCAALRRELGALVDGTRRRLLVDLSALEFIDAAGIATLYQATGSFVRMAVVIVPGSRVAQMVQACGLDQMLPLAAGRAEAVRALA